MSAPGTAEHGTAQPETRLPEASRQEISELRERVEALLAWAEGKSPGSWEVAEEQHAFVASISDLFGVSLPLSTFRTAGRAASFLRVVALALQG